MSTLRAKRGSLDDDDDVVDDAGEKLERFPLAGERESEGMYKGENTAAGVDPRRAAPVVNRLVGLPEPTKNKMK